MIYESPYGLPGSKNISRANNSQFVTISECFLPPKFHKYHRNNLKFSEKVLPIQLHNLVKMIITKQYLEIWHSTKAQFLTKFEKMIFEKCFAIFMPILPPSSTFTPFLPIFYQLLQTRSRWWGYPTMRNLLWFDLFPATLLKLTLFHGCFSRFLNCTNGSKSPNASHI